MMGKPSELTAGEPVVDWPWTPPTLLMLAPVAARVIGVGGGALEPLGGCGWACWVTESGPAKEEPVPDGDCQSIVLSTPLCHASALGMSSVGPSKLPGFGWEMFCGGPLCVLEACDVPLPGRSSLGARLKEGWCLASTEKSLYPKSQKTGDHRIIAADTTIIVRTTPGFVLQDMAMFVFSVSFSIESNFGRHDRGCFSRFVRL